MTPDEAIETLQDGEDGTVKMLEAKRLGIEALERLKGLRSEENPHSSFNPLGGRTQLLHDAWEDGRKRAVALLPSERG